VAAHPGGQDEEQGPHPFAAAQQDMPPHLGDERHVGPEIGVQSRIDGGKVLLQGGLQQLFGGGIHVNKLAYIPRDVNLLDEDGHGRHRRLRLTDNFSQQIVGQGPGEPHRLDLPDPALTGGEVHLAINFRGLADQAAA